MRAPVIFTCQTLFHARAVLLALTTGGVSAGLLVTMAERFVLPSHDLSLHLTSISPFTFLCCLFFG